MYQIPHNENEKEIIYLLKTTNRTRLSVASNFPYELYLNKKFIGSGGHRCTDTEIYIDTWPGILITDSIIVRYQWFNYNKMSVWHRRIFPTAIFVDVDGVNSWSLSVDPTIKFGEKVCAQLPHQNIISNASQSLINLSLRIIDQHPYILKPLPIKPGSYISITPKIIYKNQQVTIHSNFKKLASIVWPTNPNLKCDTYDLGYIGLHRFEIDTTKSGVILYYGEVSKLCDALQPANRSKVKLADAIKADVKSGAPFGMRGCRYVHVIYSEVGFVLRAWRYQYNFNWKFLVDKVAPGCDKIVSACKNNLIACVDGGVVDTCWRERAQWTGDARMSLMALNILTTNTEIIEFVLDQIAQSYDPVTGMVQGAYPIKKAGYNCEMPIYHLAFCYTVIEYYGRDLSKEIRACGVVLQSINVWKNKYVTDSMLIGMPGWYFLDWDKTDDLVTDKLYGFKKQPHSVCNAMYYDLCQILKVDSGLDMNKFNEMFCWKNYAYSICQKGFPSIHATAMICALESLKDVHIGKEYLLTTINDNFSEIRTRVTAYFAYFIAKALEYHDVESMIPFIKKFYDPIVEKYSTIYEKTSPHASMAHGWSVGIVSLIVK